jgi:hypothetical protein
MNNNKSLKNINLNFSNIDFNEIFNNDIKNYKNIIPNYINNNPNYDEETNNIKYINNNPNYDEETNNIKYINNNNILPHAKSIKDNIDTINNILLTGNFSFNNLDHIFTISILLIFFGSILYVIFNIFS